MDQDQFKAMFDFGSSGEQVVGDWLGSKNIAHYALHSLGLLDHGPRVRLADNTTVACPDLICWGIPPHPNPPAQADQYFVEVKRFKRWWEPGGGVKQTGIEEARVAEYKALATASGKTVYIYFLQMNELMQGEGLFFGDISTLPVAGRTLPPDGKALSMYDANALVRLADGDALAWFDPAKPPDEPDDEPPAQFVVPSE